MVGTCEASKHKPWEWQWVFMTPPNAKKGVGNKEEGIGHQEPT